MNVLCIRWNIHGKDGYSESFSKAGKRWITG